MGVVKGREREGGRERGEVEGGWEWGGRETQREMEGKKWEWGGGGGGEKKLCS